MKTIKKVIITPVFLEDYMIPFEEMEENKIYISEKYKTSIHRCLCGCGLETVLPLNKNGDNQNWTLIKESDGSISFTPSILNPFIGTRSLDEELRYEYGIKGCGSHYIITKNVANFV